MAVYNEIGIGRWNRFIQKLTDIKGGPPARQLSSEIAFQHEIFSGQEVRSLQGWDRFGLGSSVAAVVGQQSAARIRNPAGSNVVAVIEKCLVSSAVAMLWTLGYQQVSLDQNSLFAPAGFQMETRGRNAPTLIASFNTGVPLNLNSIAQLTLLANSTFDIIGDEEIVKFARRDRKSTRLNSSHTVISYAVFCLKKKKNTTKNCLCTLRHSPVRV